jgi:hypothetical protein
MREQRVAGVSPERMQAWNDSLAATQIPQKLDGFDATPAPEEIPVSSPYFEYPYLLEFTDGTSGEFQGVGYHTLRALSRNVHRVRAGRYGALPDLEAAVEPIVSTYDQQRGIYVDSVHCAYLVFAAKNYRRIRDLGPRSANNIQVFLVAHELW